VKNWNKQHIMRNPNVGKGYWRRWDKKTLHAMPPMSVCRSSKTLKRIHTSCFHLSIHWFAFPPPHLQFHLIFAILLPPFNTKYPFTSLFCRYHRHYHFTPLSHKARHSKKTIRYFFKKTSSDRSLFEPPEPTYTADSSRCFDKETFQTINL